VFILPLIVVYYIIKRIRNKHIQTLNKDNEKLNK